MGKCLDINVCSYLGETMKVWILRCTFISSKDGGGGLISWEVIILQFKHVLFLQFETVNTKKVSLTHP